MTPTRHEDTQATFAATLVDEWVRGGVQAAVVCPGSRSTPLALALAADDRIALHVHHDERSAGFMALGLALATGQAVVVLTTSGTAAVELHPAVVEAHHAGVPLLVCTADRPPELRDVGAPQTIDQNRLYGGAVRWYADPGLADWESAPRWRAFAARALAETAGPPPGPVQLNLPFREPLVGTPEPLLPPGRDGHRPWTMVPPSPVLWPEDLDVAALGERRGLILAGHPCGDPDDVARVAEGLGWPVVADPQSPAWAVGAVGSVGSDAVVGVAHLDAILRSEAARQALRPEVVLRLGRPPASRVVDEWLAASGAEEIVVPGATWTDPPAAATVIVRAHPADVLRSLADEIVAVDREPGWIESWTAVAGAASAATEAALAELPAPNEPGVARDLVAALPVGAGLVISSSMPIRDVERYAAPRGDLRVFANRGANGIDGVVSTAVGVALAGGPVALLIGDLAFLHDSNGLLGVARRDVDLVCVVVDNDGGGIFSFLPQARHLESDRFEALFGTPHGLDLVALAAALGVSAHAVGGDRSDGSDGRDLAAEVARAVAEGGVHVLVVHTDRAANVGVHQQLDAAIARAVDAALA
ncbi:MAG TPA: 2-succinyl-5-enolpyruvyl-6-hydroxy-3-cyclohexene-1-carboxylic-acid synthase [Acidimicrobiales bacterium]|nr:2-succinyl-5-enolpyruvyl-6-hydroxy-3-cyclohexene-1-carboxylic-acid synthase [Acidimicrobiales bacterium]